MKERVLLSSKEIFRFFNLQGNFLYLVWSNIQDLNDVTLLSLLSPPLREQQELSCLHLDFREKNIFPFRIK